MMHYFPKPYPDELLYSVLARYSKEAGNINTISNIEDMFGSRNVISSPELPGKIDMLISSLPDYQYTSDYFIHTHTMFPYISSFLPEDRAREVSALMKEGHVSLIYNKSGLISSCSINQNRQFRFCPECMKEDILNLGETYWHRLHQITEVLICPKHKVPLHKSRVLMRGAYRQSFIAADDENCISNEAIGFSPEASEKLFMISENVQQVLMREFTYQNVNEHKFLYMQKLIDLRYANLNGMIHQKRLRNAMLGFWGEEVLRYLQCPIEPDKDCSWLNSLVRENSIPAQPIRHLLLCRFLGMDIAELLDYQDGGQNHKDIWEDKLLSLVNKGLSIREIAKIIDSTPKTVRKYMDKFGIEQFWINNGGGKYIKIPFTQTPEFVERRDDAREKWLQLIKENPDLSRNKVKKLDETLYTRLYRYDKEWVYAHSPTTKASRQSYWETKDAELLPKVIAVVDDMYCGKPERILWTNVGGKLGIGGWFTKRKDKMPQVRAFLEKRVETLQEFQIRKLKWAIDELEMEGETATKWKLLEKAGVKPRYISDIRKEVGRILEEKGCDSSLLD
nr:TnsD family Tn7-like transposition protein [uncultured Anaerosporobacter sp.]